MDSSIQKQNVPEYEVFAIKYAELKARPASDTIIGADPHDAPFDMAYYVWLIRSRATVFVVDTGFSKAAAERRGRHFLRSPADGLKVLQVDPAAVTNVIVTHLHYDHIGNAALFPNALFHVQDKEAAFATGRYMRHRFFRDMYEVEDVVGFVRDVYANRVVFHEGDDEIAPGLTVHLSSGHTLGLQFVRVHTRQGWLVLAADACHYTRLRTCDEVYPVVFDPGGLLENYRRLCQLASSDHLVIPGHDPLVMTDYPPAAAGLEDIAVRLD